MNILLLGATGATGKELLRHAQHAGHSLTVLIRNPKRMPVGTGDLRIILGDATNENDLRAAMTGNELLISALGGMNASIMTKSTQAIVAASRDTNLSRIIMLSSFAANRTQLTRSARLLTTLVMRKIIDDKNTAEGLLRKSNLNWTIVYATTLTNADREEDTYVMPPSKKAGLRNTIARTNVAKWILAEVEHGQYINNDVVITTK